MSGDLLDNRGDNCFDGGLTHVTVYHYLPTLCRIV